MVNSTAVVAHHRGRLEREHDLVVGADLANVPTTPAHLAVDLDVRGEYLRQQVELGYQLAVVGVHQVLEAVQVGGLDEMRYVHLLPQEVVLLGSPAQEEVLPHAVQFHPEPPHQVQFVHQFEQLRVQFVELEERTVRRDAELLQAGLTHWFRRGVPVVHHAGRDDGQAAPVTRGTVVQAVVVATANRVT